MSQSASGSTIPLVTLASSDGATLVTVTTSGALSVTISTAGGAGSTAVTVQSSAGTALFGTTPGTVLSASSGLVQVSGIPTVVVTTSGGVWGGIPAVSVTTSGGLGASNVRALSSGTVTLSSQITVTAVSASSGLVQVSGVPTVVVTTSAGVWSGVPVVNVTTSGGIGAGTQVVQLSTASIGGLTGFFKTATSVNTPFTVSSSAPATLYSCWAFTTGLGTSVLELYNATSSNVTLGTTLPILRIPVSLASAVSNEAGGFSTPVFPPQGVKFATAISAAMVVTTSGVAPAQNTWINVITAP